MTRGQIRTAGAIVAKGRQVVYSSVQWLREYEVWTQGVGGNTRCQIGDDESKNTGRQSEQTLGDDESNNTRR